MGLKAGWLALFIFVWIIGAFLGSTFEYHSTDASAGVAYTTGTATFETNNATVVGAGTAWVVAMENGVIKCDDDGIWYKIIDVADGTHLTLAAVYNETGGAGKDYTMQAAPGWAGTGTGGYATSPVTKLEYLLKISNAWQFIEILGGAIPFPVPNMDYFSTAFEVLTWQWSFMDGYEMIYWIFFVPFIVMGVLCMLLLVYGILTGNISLG